MRSSILKCSSAELAEMNVELMSGRSCGLYRRGVFRDMIKNEPAFSIHSRSKKKWLAGGPASH
jgi:hypothetical protein